ncbi:hypothetical protein CTAYLR_007103 [Chrysophaeum taylorii]|uniref:Uncharacterized protein n=1 Tax=Chrysophaeum taylorii TaxID=2483200 RepID=A0AAD7XSR1_9STRA|nr:hypothetical protein CTAYLR_007103 [Chrysophaeum taylorii]
MRRFADRARVCVRGGAGGKGSVAWDPIRGARKGFGKRPTGGSGGRGGDVIVAATESLDSLSSMPGSVVCAGGGANGERRMRHGIRGENTTLFVPCGTVVRASDDDDPEKDASTEVHNLTTAGSSAVVARGGRGGRGNGVTRTRAYQNKYERGPPTPGRSFGHVLGQPGEARTLDLELRTIADVGLVGKPNAGKSSLLRALSAAEPEVAAYPFTTLRPHVGVCELWKRREGAVVDRDALRIADVPGLVEGAAEGRGLGLDFLRHVSRTKALVFVVDASRGFGAAIEDLVVVASEIAASKCHARPPPALVFANKLDLVRHRANLVRQLRDAILQHSWAPAFMDVLGGSALTGLDIPALALRLHRLVRVDLEVHDQFQGEEERGENPKIGDGGGGVMRPRPLPAPRTSRPSSSSSSSSSSS